jgi:hypothetical protein
MVIHETKLSILDVLDKHSRGLHLRKLAEATEGSFPNIRRFVQVLQAEGVVVTEPFGNLLTVRLAPSLLTLAYLKFVHTSRFLALSSQTQTIVHDLMQKLSSHPIIVLVSSLKSSSLDITFVFQDLEHVEAVKKTIQSVAQYQGISIRPQFFDHASFSRTLSEAAQMEQQIRDTGIIFLGVEYYYELLWRMKT